MVIGSLVGASPQQFRDVGRHNGGSGESLHDSKIRGDGKVGRQRDPVSIRMEPAVPFVMPKMKPARDQAAPRRSYVMKRHFDDLGYTADCDGCTRLSAGMKSRPHTGKSHLPVCGLGRGCTKR